MKNKAICLAILFLLIGSNVFSQITTNQLEKKPDSRFSVFTTWLSFSNFGKTETNTQHYELQARYYLTKKDAIGLKLATWKLFAPMGIPIWNEQFLATEAFYPGRLRENGIGISYQRMLWKGLFAAVEIMPIKTSYLDYSKQKIASGFKLYNSYHLGYHIALGKKKRFFIEPQFHVNHWPINTNVPESFNSEEDQWNNYFFMEPNLYIGMKF